MSYLMTVLMLPSIWSSDLKAISYPHVSPSKLCIQFSPFIPHTLPTFSTSISLPEKYFFSTNHLSPVSHYFLPLTLFFAALFSNALNPSFT